MRRNSTTQGVNFLLFPVLSPLPIKSVKNEAHGCRLLANMNYTKAVVETIERRAKQKNEHAYFIELIVIQSIGLAGSRT